MALFRRKMNRGLQKTRDNFSGNLDNVLGSFESIDEDLYEELVEVLVMSDVGVMTSEQIVEETKERVLPDHPGRHPGHRRQRRRQDHDHR